MWKHFLIENLFRIQDIKLKTRMSALNNPK